MRKVSYIPLENILADDPLPRMSRKGWIFDRREGCQFTFLINFNINCTWANYLGNHSLMQTQCCREAQELQAVDNQLAVTTRIPDALWDRCKLSTPLSKVNVRECQLQFDTKIVTINKQSYVNLNDSKSLYKQSAKLS